MIRPHICHGYHGLYLWRKICHVEKFQISVKNLNNLWSFIEIYAVFVLNLCGEKSVWRKSLWRKNDKYEVCGDGDGHDDSVNSGQPISPVRAPVAELTLSLG